MMDLRSMGSGGGGNSSSSTSNLSALAPPFTVGRSNPTTSSSPLFHYPDSSFISEPFSHGWPYAPAPSAPRSEQNFDPTLADVMTLADNYQFSGTESFGPSPYWPSPSAGAKSPGSGFPYGGDVKCYFDSYVSHVAGKGSSLVVDGEPLYDVMHDTVLSVSSPVDYTQSLAGLDFTPSWDNGWGLDGGNLAKLEELDGSFSRDKGNAISSLAYKHFATPGECSFKYESKSKENAGITYQKFGNFPESRTDLHMDEHSCLDQNLSFDSRESARNHILTSSSTYPSSDPLGMADEVHDLLSHYQNSYNPYDKFLEPLDPSYNGTISARRPFSTVVIRPPAGSNSLSQSSFYQKTADICNTPGILNKESDDQSLPEQNEGKKESTDKTRYDVPKQGSGHGCSASSSVKALSSTQKNNNPVDTSDKARYVPQLPYVNVLGGASLENSSDCLDHHNTAVDSPCWKGAPASHFSSFNDVEAGKSHHFEKKMESYYDFDHEKCQNFVSLNESVGAAFKAPIDDDDERGSVGNTHLSPEKQDGECQTRGIAAISCKGVQASKALDKPISESGLPSSSGSGLIFSDAKRFSVVKDETSCMKQNFQADAADAAGAVAFHVAERVLFSPSSEEEDPDQGEPQKNPEMDVQTLIKAMNNLSELLLFQFSNDACLVEQNYEALKHVMSNLDLCMSKNITHTATGCSINIPGDASEKLGDTHDQSSAAGHSQVKNVLIHSHVQDVHDEDRNYNLFCKKEENLPAYLKDDTDLLRDDDLSQAIKKVLDENFHYNEELNPETILFKNLWLEAEANLCSISYKARFNHMKIEMENIKPNKAKGNVIVMEKMSDGNVIPYQSIASQLATAGKDDTAMKSTIMDYSFPKVKPVGGKAIGPESAPLDSSFSGMRGSIDEVEASVMARFNILKSCGENSMSINMDGEGKSTVVAGEFAGVQQPELAIGDFSFSGMRCCTDEIEAPVMARFSILKSRGLNTKLMDMVEERQVGMVEGGFADVQQSESAISDSSFSGTRGCMDNVETSVMDRFNIVKSRGENSKLINMDVQRQPRVVDAKFASVEQPEVENFDVSARPYLTYSGHSAEVTFGSYIDGSGNEPVKDHLHEVGVAAARSSNSSKLRTQVSSGWYDNSSSDWEHVLRDDFP